MTEARQLVDAVAHRLPGQHNIYPSIDTAVKHIAKRLFWHKSNMIVSDTGLSLSMTTSDSTVALPSDFWALKGYPYPNGEKWHYDPLPDLGTRLVYSSDGVSKYYEILNATLRLTPPTSSAITVNGDYFVKPTEITQPTSEIPWNGLFDDAIQEFLIKWYAVGAGGKPEYSMTIASFFNDAVDLIVPYRDKTAPDQVVQVIDWEDD